PSDAHRLFFRPRRRESQRSTKRGRFVLRTTWRSAVCVAIRNTHVARSKQGSLGARYVSVRLLLGTFVRALCWIVGRGSIEERPRSCLTCCTSGRDSGASVRWRIHLGS